MTKWQNHFIYGKLFRKGQIRVFKGQMATLRQMGIKKERGMGDLSASSLFALSLQSDG
jgi:hypothetical protein